MQVLFLISLILRINEFFMGETHKLHVWRELDIQNGNREDLRFNESDTIRKCYGILL